MYRIEVTPTKRV
ncbi:hypothetical protein Bhyg_14322 [Pseudolycoriella hygida]|uniref:Uncharacterized protein n=1 Tax=Pseudolycoriella hygida TaxID=35572 RepID=A0A9Q0MPS4_9DIPT|nr:hypothetical protein Bhyg_14322 [Pseudolycoriella hygida]